MVHLALICRCMKIRKFQIPCEQFYFEICMCGLVELQMDIITALGLQNGVLLLIQASLLLKKPRSQSIWFAIILCGLHNHAWLFKHRPAKSVMLRLALLAFLPYFLLYLYLQGFLRDYSRQIQFQNYAGLALEFP